MNKSNEADYARTEAELRSLDPPARFVLAVLAVVVPASLSVEQLGEITEVSEPELSLAELERRGLVVREGDRYTLAPEERGRLKRLLASLDTIDRVLRGFIQIAEDGRLTIADLDAVLELTRIAAATGRWTELLRLAEAAQATLATARRAEEWVEIVERWHEAAEAVGDSHAAIRAEQELARLRSIASRPGVATVRTTLAVLTAAAVGAVGFGAGYLIGDQSSADSDTDPANGATTVTETETETEAAETVTETVTETETETETVTEIPEG